MNDNQRSLLIVAALIWNDDELLLVEQQDPDDPAPSWALPGGVVDHDELLGQALIREVREETGLTVTGIGPLVYTAQVINEPSGDCSTSFVFEIFEWEGVPAPRDPDSLVLSARFMQVGQATAKLASLPWRVMHEPITTYLRGRAGPGRFWGYRADPDGKVTLVESSDV